MATNMIRQTMFTTGEVDEITWKRTDVEEYLSSAQSLLNFEVGTTGLAEKRKGTIALLNVTSYSPGLNSKLYEFVDKNGVYYAVLAVNLAFIIFSSPLPSFTVETGSGRSVITRRGTYVVTGDFDLTYVQTVVSPYLISELSSLDYSQDDDSLVFTHPDHPVARLYISNYSPLTFAYQILNIYPLPAYDFGTVNYNNYTVTLSVSSNTLTFQFHGVGGSNPFSSAWIGGQIVGGGISETSPIGYAIITNVSYSSGGGGVTTFTATVQQPFETVTYATVGSQYSVRQPSWVQTAGNPFGLGYPAKVLFFQNRLWVGNTKLLSNTIFGSKINAPINFDVGTGEDNDAIIYKIGQTNSGAINWLNGGKQMEIFCQNFEFSAPQDQNAALTPSTFSIRQQSSYGSSSLLKPQNYLNDTYYSSRTGKSLINYHFTGVGLSYQSTSISVASSHLVKNPNNRALLRGSDTSQDNFIYFLNKDDNTITAFQFAYEFKLAALTPIKFSDNVTLVDMVTINNKVYILKYYNLTAQFMIEVFDETTFIDSQESHTMATSGLITGLDRFNGYKVQVVFEKQDFGEYVVEGGQIIVDNRNQFTGLAEVGLLYNVELRTMYPFAGSENAPLFKNLSRIYVDYYQSLDFYINGKLIPYQSFLEIQAGLPLTPKTDTAVFSPVSGWARFDRDAIVITQSAPFDLQILGIAYQVEVAVI